LIFSKQIFFFILFCSTLFPIDNLRHVKNITSLLSSTSIEPLDDEYLLVTTSGGIYLSNYEGSSLIDYTNKLQYANINTIAKNSDNIWLGGGDGTIQILDNDLNLESVIDYIPFDSIKKIVFYKDYAFAIASYQNKDVIVQYSSTNNPNYLNYFSFDSFLIDAGNDIEQIINATVIYDILIQNDRMYLGTNEGLLQVDLSTYNNNLLLLLDWRLEDPITDVVSFVDGYDEYPLYIVTEEGSSGFNINQNEILDLNPSDIRKSFYIDNTFYLLTDEYLLGDASNIELTDLDIIFNLPDNIYSNFTDVKVLDNDLYFTLENHGIIKTSILNTDEYEYIIPNTLFSNRIITLDVNLSKEIVGLGGHVDIAQGGFFMNNIINDHSINNFYSDGDNYEDLDNNYYHETYKYKYPNNITADYSEYNGKNLSYISGHKNSEGIKFDSGGNFYFINNALYLNPEEWHPYAFNLYNPIKDEVDYLSGLLHINSSNLSIIDGWDSIFRGIGDYDEGFNYVPLSQIKMDSNDNLWIVNPQSEGDVNKPLVVNSDNTWIQIEDLNTPESYFLPEEIAFDNNNNVWIAYQKDDDETYSPGGIKIATPLSNGGYAFYPPLSSVEESTCYQYNDDLLLDDVSVWSIDIGSDQYGNTILWTLSDYGVMGYVIVYIYSETWNSLSLSIEPISCNFYFSDVSFDQLSKIRIDNQNNAWIASNTGVRVVRSNGDIGYNNQIINSRNTELFSDMIYDIEFDDYGYVYFATDFGISIFETTFAKEQSVSNISVSPNPFIIGDDNQLTISNLSSNSIVQIMTLSGKLVKEFILTQESSIINWNGQSDNGKMLSTGIYLVAVLNTSNGKTGVTKLAIIRK